MERVVLGVLFKSSGAAKIKKPTFALTSTWYLETMALRTAFTDLASAFPYIVTIIEAR